MDSSHTVIPSQKILVEIFGTKGIRLDAIYPGDQTTKILPPGKYVFYTVPVTSLAGKSEIWVFYDGDSAFGVPLERLRGLHTKEILWATRSDGSEYFNDAR